MIVADTNIITYLMIKGKFTDQAEKVFYKDSDWVVPELWKHEFLNIMATLVSTKRSELNDVITCYEKAIKLFSRLEKEPNYHNVLTISIRHKISAYDAQFIALAMESDLPLITQDKQLTEKFPDFTQTMDRFIS